MFLGYGYWTEHDPRTTTGSTSETAVNKIAWQVYVVQTYILRRYDQNLSDAVRRLGLSRQSLKVQGDVEKCIEV